MLGVRSPAARAAASASAAAAAAMSGDHVELGGVALSARARLASDSSVEADAAEADAAAEAEPSADVCRPRQLGRGLRKASSRTAATPGFELTTSLSPCAICSGVKPFADVTLGSAP